MAGNLTNLLAIFLPLKLVHKIEGGVSRAVLNFKHPKAIEYQVRQRDWYGCTSSLETRYINPHYPHLFSGRRFVRKNRHNALIEDDFGYDKLPKCFFENQNIKSFRVPFDYWFPKWWRNNGTGILLIGLLLLCSVAAIILAKIISG